MSKKNKQLNKQIEQRRLVISTAKEEIARWNKHIQDMLKEINDFENMKCILINCNKEADLPYYACSLEHGIIWKNIKEAIKEGSELYQKGSRGFTEMLTPEEIRYYKPLIK